MSESSTSGEGSESSGNSDSARDESSSQELICDREDQVDTEEHLPTTDEGFDDTEMDDGVDNDGINIGNINVPVNDIRTDPDALLTYHQKFQAARDKVKDSSRENTEKGNYAMDSCDKICPCFTTCSVSSL